MKQLLLTCLCLLSFRAYAQTFSTGLIFDDDAYESVEMKAPLTRGLYSTMPQSASLKMYCPYPGNQGDYGTCVGWATSYAAWTILWAKQNRQTDKAVITAHAFSPDFVYKSVVPYDSNCKNGTQVPLALAFIKTTGDV